MADPITMAIASAVAGKAAESMTDQARQCLAVLVRRIREKFRDRPARQAALEAVPGDPGTLARALDEASAEDPEFGTQIRELWYQVGMQVAAGDQGTVNVFHGHAGKVVQLRDVHGDLSIG